MRSQFRRMLPWLNLSVLLLASGFSTQLFAQNASISGQVLNSGEATVPGAAITILNTDTQVTLKAVSDNSGVFILTSLVPGRYEVTVTAAGFSPWVQSGIVLEGGEV